MKFITKEEVIKKSVKKTEHNYDIITSQIFLKYWASGGYSFKFKVTPFKFDEDKDLSGYRVLIIDGNRIERETLYISSIEKIEKVDEDRIRVKLNNFFSRDKETYEMLFEFLLGKKVSGLAIINKKEFEENLNGIVNAE